jgi:hypothetical protein
VTSASVSGSSAAGAREVRGEDVGVGRVEHAALHRGAEQRVRVVHQVGVERVVPGHEHHQRGVRGAPGPAGLLPERGPGAGEARHQHGVEPGDVDAQLEGVGGGHPDQVPPGERGLQRAALLGQVAAAVGRDPRGQVRVDLAEQPLGLHGGELRAPPRPHEGERAGVLHDEVGEHPRALGTGGAAHGRAVLAARAGQQRRLPQHDGAPGPRGGVVGDGPDRPPVSRVAKAAGSATVAEASTTTGRAP